MFVIERVPAVLVTYEHGRFPRVDHLLHFRPVVLYLPARLVASRRRVNHHHKVARKRRVGQSRVVRTRVVLIQHQVAVCVLFARVTDTVAVDVGLVGVAEVGAVVQVVDHAVTVQVRIAHVTCRRWASIVFGLYSFI